MTGDIVNWFVSANPELMNGEMNFPIVLYIKPWNRVFLAALTIILLTLLVILTNLLAEVSQYGYDFRLVIAIGQYVFGCLLFAFFIHQNWLFARRVIIWPDRIDVYKYGENLAASHPTETIQSFKSTVVVNGVTSTLIFSSGQKLTINSKMANYLEAADYLNQLYRKSRGSQDLH